MRRRYFVSAEELKAYGDEVVIVDCDLPAAYQRLHLPKAHLAPCRYWKADGSDEGLYGMEDPGRLNSLVADWGLCSDTPLVAYDSSGGLNAARLGWTFERFGFHNVQVLDGGVNSWIQAGYPLTQKLPSPKPSQFSFQVPTDFNLCGIEQVSQKVDSGAVLWDDRSQREWDSGRIPGAVHLEWTQVLNDSGRLESESLVRGMLAENSVTPDKEICVYCQGGIRASHSYWVLKHLGFERVTIFDGSWAEYSQSGLPVQS